ncbi:MAG: exonuclease domain-containing protein [Candidatus Helarchaeota archaeon]
MAKINQIINIVDIEATCWENKAPIGQEMEIIEIGICAVNRDTGEILEKRDILVRPQNSIVSDYCTQLTTLTQLQVNSGISLKEACAILEREFDSKQRVWASWGDFDKKQFERECGAKNISYPFGLEHINLKKLFAKKMKLPQEIEVKEALQLLGLKFEGTYHRAIDDVYNIAIIYAKLLSI